MNKYPYSPSPLAHIAEAKLQLRKAARDTNDVQLKTDINHIATEVDDLIKRNSRIGGGE